MKRIKGSLIRKSVTALAVAAFALVLAGQSVFSQGLVAFANTGAFATTADRRVYDPVTCAPLVGTNWVAALYFGAEPDHINNLAVRSLEDHSLLSAIARFRNVDPSHSLAGTWSGGFRTLLDATVGQTFMMQVRVWDMSKFATFDEAKAMGGYAMESTPFSYQIPRSSDPFALQIDNFRGITPPGCVPEPSVFGLAMLGVVAIGAWRLTSRHGHVRAAKHME